MAETEHHDKQLPETAEKQLQDNEQEEESSFSQAYFNEDADSEELDLESTYLIRLREQRKRIEDLSLSLTQSKEKYEEEASRVRSLEAQLAKYQSDKSSSLRYEEITIQYQTTQQQNEELKEELQDLRKEIFDLTCESTARQQKMANDYNSQRRKDQNKMEALEDRLSEKEDQIEALQKALKNKQKEIKQVHSSFNSRISDVKNEYEQKIIIEQKKVEKIESKLQNNKSQQSEQNLSHFLRENERLKQQNFRLGRLLEEREKQMSYQNDKFKSKLSALKKQLKNKDKQYEQVRSNLNKIEKERKDHTTEKEDLKVQTIKIREQFQTTIIKKENDFYVERRNLKMTIDQHAKTIEDLFKLKEQLVGRIKQLESILKRKEANEKHRKSLLKDEMKEIDKLEKVIDRIVE